MTEQIAAVRAFSKLFRKANKWFAINSLLSLPLVFGTPQREQIERKAEQKQTSRKNRCVINRKRERDGLFVDKMFSNADFILPLFSFYAPTMTCFIVCFFCCMVLFALVKVKLIRFLLALSIIFFYFKLSLLCSFPLNRGLLCYMWAWIFFTVIKHFQINQSNAIYVLVYLM